MITAYANTSAGWGPGGRAGGECGLVGIAVDPDFETNGYIYVSYTAAEDNRDRLSRLTMTGNTAGSELVLLKSDQAANSVHHGGELDFGPDGKLYWAVGDNTFSPNSQDLSNIHGKILCLSPDGSIPTDNPFYNTPGAERAMYAYGFRNPFRFTFTPDGQLLVGDVGSVAWEELNVVTPGAN
jgi:glucose/arabinose dehydrogenase